MQGPEASAVQSGFIPAGTATVPVVPLHHRVQKAIRIVADQYADDDLDRNSVAQEVGLSANYFGELFKQETGVNFIDYVTDFRIRQAEGLLKTTRLEVVEIAAQTGFHNATYFHRVFKNRYCTTPQAFRQEFFTSR